MKMKKLMLVALVLLAILTIGAASAADDVASDDLAVEEGDVIDVSQDDEVVGEMDTDDVDIEVDEVVSQQDTSANFTNVEVTEKDGNFVICTGEGEDTVELYRENLYESDRYIYDEEYEVYNFGVSLDDINSYIALNIDSEKNFYDIVQPEQTVRFVLEYLNTDFIVQNYAVDFNGEGITFTEITDGTDEDQYYIYVNEEILDITDVYADENPDFTGIILPPGTFGDFKIGRIDQDDNVIENIFTSDVPENYEGEERWFIDDDGNIHGAFYLKDIDLDEINHEDGLKFYFVNADGDEESEFTIIADVSKTDTTIQFLVRDENDEEEDDSDDGVIIYVPDGDEKVFDLDNEDDLNTAFAYVSVQNGFDGKIAIMIWNEEEGDEQELWSKSLDEITDSEEDLENDGFTVYRISLSDINNYGDLIDCGSFKLAFIDDNNDEIDSRSYNIEVDEDNDNIIRFWEDNEGDEPSGEGDELEGVEFRSANAQNNDIVIVIPMANFPEDITNEFTVIVLTEEDEIHTNLKLDELDHDDSSYYIRVNDLYIDDVEIGEGTGMDIIVQFYDEDDNPIYYAQDDIGIFNSPYIFEETSIYADDDVITFQEVPEGVDEFNVTIQKEGGEPVEKTFKFSELGNQYEEDEEDEEGGVWYALKLKDLGINQTGEYQITVKFSEELTYSGNLSVTRDIDVRFHNEEWNEDSEQSEVREFTSVDDLVVNMRIAENVKGSVKLTIGENEPIVINFTDLRYEPGYPPHDGRQILLNDLNITESGTYTIKIEIYDENGDLIEIYDDDVLIEEFNLLVTVKENNVEFNDAYYTAEIFDVIKFTISTPLSSGQYYNIYFNDELAGKFSLDGIVITNNKFYDDIWGDGEDDDVKFIKYGDYNVNVTFFDGENESATRFTGNFSIKSLNMAADKDKYSIDENVTIIFDAQEAGGYYPVLDVQYAKGWGYMGPFFDEDWEMAFAGEEITELIKDGKFTVNIGKLPEGTNYIYVAYYLFDSEDAYHDDDDAVFDFHDLMPIEVSAPVEPVDPGLAISPIADVGEGVDVTVTVTANDTFKGVVTVLVNNNEVGTIDMGAGESSLVVGAGNFTVGENTVKVTSEAIGDFAAGE
ncbi:hypothetical protein, partial [Methanobrevibacter sp.]